MVVDRALAVALAVLCGCGGGAGDESSGGSSGEGSSAESGTSATSASTSTTGSTSTSDDGDASGSTESGDEAPPACGGDPCVAGAPMGWNGPAAIATSDFDEMGACPPGWSEVAQAEAYADVAAPELACSCGACQLEGSCDDPVLQGYSAQGCGSAVGSPIELSPDVCHGEFFYLWLEVTRPDPVGVGCSAIASDEGSTPAAFATRTLGCTPPPGDACDGGTCWDGDATPDASICVWQDGDVDCPVGWEDRTVRYRELVDDRACSCACDPVDPLCDGTITGWWGDPCFGNVEDIAFDTCTYAQTQSWMYDGGLTGGCTDPVAAQTGAATPTEPVTFCCR